MAGYSNELSPRSDLNVSPEVGDYIEKRGCDFRVCTSCGGPILLPIRVKPPKNTDILVKTRNHTIYVSIHQVRYISEITSDMIPFYEEDAPEGYEAR
jgi:hypothetical protein